MSRKDTAASGHRHQPRSGNWLMAQPPLMTKAGGSESPNTRHKAGSTTCPPREPKIKQLLWFKSPASARDSAKLCKFGGARPCGHGEGYTSYGAPFLPLTLTSTAAWLPLPGFLRDSYTALFTSTPAPGAITVTIGGDSAPRPTTSLLESCFTTAGTDNRSSCAAGTLGEVIVLAGIVERCFVDLCGSIAESLGVAGAIADLTEDTIELPEAIGILTESPEYVGDIAVPPEVTRTMAEPPDITGVIAEWLDITCDMVEPPE
mmetsp:Transcript_36079/g.103831  ORF Transcript_36079/g.103831 Transcript_36079/m.103831 type:complete len:261 (-) Transcript_36079:802-1584(-)